jgi:hypothetical protein
MAARVLLSARDLSVEPGSEVALDCSITNVSPLVASYDVGVLGDVARWADVGPQLRLMPGEEGTTRIVFRVPRSAGAAAEAEVFGVQVTSTEDPAASAVEEALLNVRVFSDTAAELVPATSHGRLHGRHELAIDNRGNRRVSARLAASDPAAALRFRFQPEVLVVGPGEAAFGRLRVSPAKRFWRGPSRTHTFEVRVGPEGGGTPLAVRGTMLQEPVLPRWTPAGVAVAAVLLAVLLAGWLGLLRPAIHSAARDAVQQPLAAQAAAVRSGQQAVDQVRAQQRTEADAIARLAGQIPPPVSPLAGNPLGSPTDGRLTGNATFKVPDKSTLSITDLVIENSNDDSGMLRVQRNGTDLLVLKLDNFRDIDYHFVTPITLTAGQRLVLVCQPAAGTTACGGAVYYSGFMKAPPA